MVLFIVLLSWIGLLPVSAEGVDLGDESRQGAD